MEEILLKARAAGKGRGSTHVEGRSASNATEGASELRRVPEVQLTGFDSSWLVS